MKQRAQRQENSNGWTKLEAHRNQRHVANNQRSANAKQSIAHKEKPTRAPDDTKTK